MLTRVAPADSREPRYNLLGGKDLSLCCRPELGHFRELRPAVKASVFSVSSGWAFSVPGPTGSERPPREGMSGAVVAAYLALASGWPFSRACAVLHVRLKPAHRGVRKDLRGLPAPTATAPRGRYLGGSHVELLSGFP